MRKITNNTTVLLCIFALVLITLSSIPLNVVSVQATPPTETTQPSPSYQLENNARYDILIRSLLAFAHMPSLSAAIVSDDELIWTHGYGLYDRENNKEAADDTIYLIASISKTFTATAIMQLYEQGYFDLDDDVNDYLPYILRNPNHPDDKITFRMLLTHQSSLATDPPTYYTRAYPGELEISGYPNPFFKDILTPEGLQYRPQFWNTYAPGGDMYYANMGFGVLGQLIECISGQTVEDYCRDHIFIPLEMNDTSFRLSNIDVTRAAVPYEYIQGAYVPYIHYTILEYPAGGLRTTVNDLSHFLIAQMNNGTYSTVELLQPDTITLMHTIQYPSTTYNFQYGLGFQIWETPTSLKIGHTGGLFGVATKMIFKPSDHIGIIMFTNKAVENIRDQLVFALIEYLLFQQAAQYTTTSTYGEKLSDIVQSNSLLSTDFNLEK
jgi:CubicO group peptidase (beta-lactamase class C family)